ncbi:pyridoxal-phosphate dependent enzyme, partial [Enterobacter hormaechei]|nr:pyridoxal-phosphate dependent enzyme [Enterobacter hormaechei]
MARPAHSAAEDMMNAFAIANTDIVDAAIRLKGQLVATRLIESEALNAKYGARILFKPECLQLSGSFKFRGAYNRISQMTADERK